MVENAALGQRLAHNDLNWLAYAGIGFERFFPRLFGAGRAGPLRVATGSNASCSSEPVAAAHLPAPNRRRDRTLLVLCARRRKIAVFIGVFEVLCPGLLTTVFVLVCSPRDTDAKTMSDAGLRSPGAPDFSAGVLNFTGVELGRSPAFGPSLSGLGMVIGGGGKTSPGRKAAGALDC
jgi:hypothetical protein